MLTPYLRSLILVGAIVLYALLSFASTEPRVSFVRPARFVMEDDPTRWQIRIEPHADHRLLIVAAVEGGEVVRRSDEQLDGDKAPRTRWVTWRTGLPAGEIEIHARVYSQTEQVGTARTSLTVLSRFGN